MTEGETTATVEEMFNALLSFRGGYGVTADAIAKHPRLVKLLKSKSSLKAVQALREVAEEVEPTPQVVAARMGIALEPGTVNHLRHVRIDLIKKKFGIELSSVYRYEKAGLRTVAHYLIDRGQEADVGHFDDERHHHDEEITLAKLYGLVQGLSESQFALKEQVEAIRKQVYEIRNGTRAIQDQLHTAPQSRPNVDVQYAQVIDSLNDISRVVKSLYVSARERTPPMPDTIERIVNDHRDKDR